MYVCMYIYIYIYVHVYIYTQLHTYYIAIIVCSLVTKSTQAPPGLAAIRSDRTNRTALRATNHSSF